MAVNLGASLIVYGFILVVFSLIFHLVMHDPACPAVNHEKFTTFGDSMFETYKLLYGHGDFHFEVNSNVKFAYVVYSIVTVLLLLNLIIAVMGTTAAVDMVTPWKNALQQQAYLEEALDADFKVKPK